MYSDKCKERSVQLKQGYTSVYIMSFAATPRRSAKAGGVESRYPGFEHCCTCTKASKASNKYCE